MAEMLMVAVIFIVSGCHGSGPSMVSKVQIQFTKEATHQGQAPQGLNAGHHGSHLHPEESRICVVNEIDMQLTLTLESRGQVSLEDPNPAHHGRRRGERRRRKVGGM